MQLHPKQSKILSAMELRGRDSFKQLADTVKIPERLVRYHIRRAEDAGFILGYKAIIDAALIGYANYLVYFRFFGLNSTEENAWAAQILKLPGVMLIARNVGRWDVTLGLIAKNQIEFNTLLSSATKSISGKIVEMAITTEVECHYSSMKILSNFPFTLLNTKSQFVSQVIDEIDSQILQELANNCRIPTSVLSEKLGLSAPAVQHRIQRLEREKILLGYWVRFNYEALGYTQFRVHLKVVDSSMEMFDRIKKELLQTGNVQSVSRYIGFANLDFRCYVKSLEELSKLISGIRDKFLDQVVQAEVSPVFMWPDIHFFPL
jgi:Lrp/AsnC family leucine-responsive transcriptional regulator